MPLKIKKNFVFFEKKIGFRELEVTPKGLPLETRVLQEALSRVKYWQLIKWVKTNWIPLKNKKKYCKFWKNRF